MNNPLRFDVLVSAPIPVVTSDLPPDATERRWSPISATLISGESDAVLVDTFITVEQNRALIDWIAATGKNLTTIYATHGHGDHCLWCKRNSSAIPEGTVRDSARRDRHHAAAGLVSCA